MYISIGLNEYNMKKKVNKLRDDTNPEHASFNFSSLGVLLFWCHSHIPQNNKPAIWRIKNNGMKDCEKQKKAKIHKYEL